MPLPKIFPIIVAQLALYLLSSCNTNPTILPKDEQIEKRGEDVRQNEEFNPSKVISNCNKKYAYLLTIVETMYTYIDGTLPNLIDKNDEQTSCIKNATNTQIFGRETINELRSQASLVVTGEKNINQFLQDLLLLRFNYLLERDKVIRQNLEGNPIEDIQSITPFPTDKRLFDWLVKSKTLIQQLEKLKKLRKFEITRFELLNYLIKETFLRCDLNKLNIYFS